MHSFLSVALGHMLDTNRQVGVVKVFQKDCQRLHRAALLDPLLKVHAMDQKAIFGLKLTHLFVDSVLNVIIKHLASYMLSHSQTCSLVDMLVHIEKVNTH